jgi:serine/threonine-protein kinase RsbW
VGLLSPHNRAAVRTVAGSQLAMGQSRCRGWRENEAGVGDVEERNNLDPGAKELLQFPKRAGYLYFAAAFACVRFRNRIPDRFRSFVAAKRCRTSFPRASPESLNVMSEEWNHTVERKIPSDTTLAREILDTLLANLASSGWAEEETFGIHLAVEEALMNAIKHGNQRDPDKSVMVEYLLSSTRMRIVIEDEGPGFDPTAVPDPTEDENLELPSGRGLMLMRTFMTEVEYNERGNRVLMTKERFSSDEESSIDEDES